MKNILSSLAFVGYYIFVMGTQRRDFDMNAPLSSEAKYDRALGPQLGLRLSRLMRERGLTDRGLATSSQVSFATIQNLRRGLGGQAGIGTVYNVSHALGVRVCWLAYGDGQPELTGSRSASDESDA